MFSNSEKPQKDQARERILGLISDGNYEPGDRLPSERALIESLEIGRSALRSAMDQLERKGVIWRHVGKGTFVSYGAANAAPDDPFVGLGQQLTPFRLMRARICIEPAIAWEAAVNASRDSISAMLAAMDRARMASSWAEYERHDDAFHRNIAEAADNLLLLALFDNLKRVHREVAWGSVTRDSGSPPRDHSSFGEHQEIAMAIEAREAERAHRAMREHLQSVGARLFSDA